MLTGEWALAISVVSLLLSLFALWHSGRMGALTLRAELRREVAELRVTMDELIGRMNRALQSAAEPPIDSAALRALRDELDGDSVQLEALRGRLSEINVVAPLCSLKTLEAKRAIARAIHTRIQQLAEKYPSAAALVRSDQARDDLASRAVTTR